MEKVAGAADPEALQQMQKFINEFSPLLAEVHTFLVSMMCILQLCSHLPQVHCLHQITRLTHLMYVWVTPAGCLKVLTALFAALALFSTKGLVLW